MADAREEVLSARNANLIVDDHWQLDQVGDSN